MPASVAFMNLIFAFGGQFAYVEVRACVCGGVIDRLGIGSVLFGVLRT